MKTSNSFDKKMFAIYLEKDYCKSSIKLPGKRGGLIRVGSLIDLNRVRPGEGAHFK